MTKLIIIPSKRTTMKTYKSIFLCSFFIISLHLGAQSSMVYNGLYASLSVEFPNCEEAILTLNLDQL